LIPTLFTDRLVLRAPQLGDAEPIAHYLNDMDVAGNLARVPFPYHLSDARAWLAISASSPWAKAQLSAIGWASPIGDKAL
jgi:RimJ/RimL family protein N-acetyltransferase